MDLGAFVKYQKAVDEAYEVYRDGIRGMVCGSTNTETGELLRYEMSRVVRAYSDRRCEYCRTLNDWGGDKRGNCIACGAPLP